MPEKTMQCPNCGGPMSVSYQGELRDQQIVCRFCGTTYDVPDTYKRVTRKSTRRKGLLRGREEVEEITEFRSDQPIAESQARPQTVPVPIHIPGLRLMGCVGIVTNCVMWLAFIGMMCGLPIGLLVAASEDSVYDWFTNTASRDNSGIKSVGVSRVLKGDISFLDVVAYSPDGSSIVGGGSNRLLLWSVETGLVTTEIDLEQLLTVDYIYFSQDGDQLILLEASQIKFYDVHNGQVQRTMDGSYQAIALSPDQTSFAVATVHDEFQLIELESEQFLRIFDENIFYVQHIVFSPDGRYVAASGNEGNLAIWDVSTGRELFKGQGNEMSVEALTFSPNNQTLVTGNSDKLEFYEVIDGNFRYKTTHTITDDMFLVKSLAFNPSGTELAIGNFFGNPVVWDVNDNRVTYQLEAERSVHMVAFSPDGNVVLGGSVDKNMYEWWLRGDLSDENDL